MTFELRQPSPQTTYALSTYLAVDLIVMPTVWQPHPNLNPSLTPIIQRAIDRIPPVHLKPSADGELFDIPNEAYERLQNYAFSQKFQIVTGSCEVDRRNHSCIHHKTDTKNDRKLDNHARKEINKRRRTLSLDSSSFASTLLMLTLKLRG